MGQPKRRIRVGTPFSTSVLTLLALQLTVAVPCALATWTPNGVPLALPRGAQAYARTIPDDAGGVIVVWQDARACSANVDIYAQRLDGSGNPLWAVDGVPVCEAPDIQSYPQIVPDLAGGAIIFWQDNRSGNDDIYAQRIDSSGHVLWAPGGVAMCTDPSYQWFGFLDVKNQMAVSDGAGGALVVWLDFRTGDPPSVFAQHVLGTGALAFGAPNGIPVCPASAGAYDAAICSNDSGGAIVTWTDHRIPYVYAQKINPFGGLQWVAAGVPVCTAATAGIQPQIDKDGAGGAVIAWVNLVDPTNSDIYAQHLDGTGARLWPADGVPVCKAVGMQLHPQIVNDGAGGAVIAWNDRRSPGDDIYAQRLNSLGNPVWTTADGTPICTAAGVQTLRALCTDGASGAIAVWEDERPGSTPYDLYAQRVLGSGSLAWGPSTGVLVAGAADSQARPSIIPDGLSGVIVVWQDYRSGPGDPAGADVYADRLSSIGLSVWAPNGILVAAPGHSEGYADIVPDGAGGAIVAWQDSRNCGDLDIYVQGIDASGDISWPVVGVPICRNPNTQQTPKMCPDGSGGAIIAWSDALIGTFSIVAQRVNSAGTALWTTDGVFVGDGSGPEITPVIATCASGGALIAWEDQRDGAHNIYVQRITDAGAIEPGWPAGGVSVSATTGGMVQTSPQVISDGACGAIVTWEDRRSGDYDIYVQRIDEFGVRRWLPDGVPLCKAIKDQTNPRLVIDRTGGAIVTWEDLRAGNLDIAARRVDSTGTPLWSVDGVPICTEVHTQFQPRISPDGRNGAIITWRDSRGGDNDIYAQRVTTTGIPLWTADGIVICNAPKSQQDPEIVADGAGGAVIAWRDGRSGDDDIYAQRIDPTGASFCVSGGTALTVAAGTQFQEVLAPDGTGGAIVAWSDFRSGRAREEDIYAIRMAPGCGTFATGVEVGGVGAAANEVSQNRPNPFNPSTTISYTLSSGGRVTVQLFDVAGRCVKTLVDEVQSAGPHQLRWNGDIDAGRAVSGAYFYRVRYPDGTSSSKKMLLLR